MPEIKITQGDITKLHTDAIVNAANNSLLGGGGVDGAIHRAAGSELLNECRTLNGCDTGQAKITKGYKLPAKYVIHTVGPVYHGGGKGEEGLLYNCYKNSLDIAEANGVKTIAFPSISTGIFGYPFNEACKVALKAINDYFLKSDAILEVYLVCFSEKDKDAYKEIYDTYFTGK